MEEVAAGGELLRCCQWETDLEAVGAQSQLKSIERSLESPK